MAKKKPKPKLQRKQVKKAPSTTAPVQEKLTAEDIEDLIGDMPGTHTRTPVPPKLEPLAEVRSIEPGVYMDENRATALAINSTRNNVRFVSMMSGSIDVSRWDAARFARHFTVALPAYPLRRAARIYLNSYLTISADARRTLRAMLAS